jgi:hypothetical protein
MPPPSQESKLAHAQALNAELGAALAARHAALEFERRFSSLDRKDAAGRELFEVRVAEARLKDAAADPLAHLDVLAALALPAAEDLERAAIATYPYLAREVEMLPAACLQALLGLQRLARIDEARTRAVFSAAREGRKLPGFEDAVDLAVESEQIFLALRRFEQLLDLGRDWDLPDVDWLLLRCTSVPGRLRLRALALRALAHAAAGIAWSPAQAELLEAFGPLELGSETALAWAAAGFSPEESVDWRAAGLKNPAQAHAWHCHGFAPQEALQWSQADLLPDESGIYVHCGAQDLKAALEIRRHLGDVQHYFNWYRLGLRVPETLHWLAQGVRSPDRAIEKKKGEVLAESAAPTQAPAGTAADPPPPLPGLEGPAMGAEAAAPEEPEATASLRAQAQDSGGAWIAWGCFNPGAAPDPVDESPAALCLPLGDGHFDLVKETEGIALPGRAQRPASFEPAPEWQAALDALRGARKSSRRNGAWHLLAWPPCQALLAWGLLFEQALPPWADAVDYQEAESWPKRWARKTEEWGEEGLPAACEVLELNGGLWMVAPKEALIRQQGLQPQAIEVPWPSAAWREQLEDFCLKMEIPKGLGHWQLLAQA